MQRSHIAAAVRRDELVKRVYLWWLVVRLGRGWGWGVCRFGLSTIEGMGDVEGGVTKRGGEAKEGVRSRGAMLRKHVVGVVEFESGVGLSGEVVVCGTGDMGEGGSGAGLGVGGDVMKADGGLVGDTDEVLRKRARDAGGDGGMGSGARRGSV